MERLQARKAELEQHVAELEQHAAELEQEAAELGREAAALRTTLARRPVRWAVGMADAALSLRGHDPRR